MDDVKMWQECMDLSNAMLALYAKIDKLRAALKDAESGPLSDEEFDIVTSENQVLKAKLAAAETSANELRRAVAELIGADPETWPNHGNAPLAIAAYVAAQHAELTALESKLAALEVLYLNSLADATQWQLYKSRKDAVIAAGMGKKVMRDSAAGAVPTSQKPVAEVLLVDGEKVIDASMAFFDSVELGTKLYLAAGAAPVRLIEAAAALISNEDHAISAGIKRDYQDGSQTWECWQELRDAMLEAAPKEQTP